MPMVHGCPRNRMGNLHPYDSERDISVFFAIVLSDLSGRMLLDTAS
nr:MAG TPA: Beta-1,4-endoglucanase [Caudoviricetes sp.]